MTADLDVPAAPGWFDGATGHGPSSADEPLGLRLAVLPARAPAGPTLAVLCGWRLGPDTTTVHPRVHVSTVVVAVDVHDGRALTSSASPPEDVPIAALVRPDRLPLPHAPTASESGFKVDLMALLGLPRVRRAYDVFLWLDDLLTDVVRVETPGDPDPTVWPTRPERAREADPLVRLSPPEAIAGLPVATQGQVALAVVPGPDPRSVAGAALLGAFQVAPAGDAALPLTVLCLKLRTRRVDRHAQLLPAAMARSGRGGFQVALDRLLGAVAAPERLFLLVLVGGVRSAVAVLELPRP